MERARGLEEELRPASAVGRNSHTPEAPRRAISSSPIGLRTASKYTRAAILAAQRTAGNAAVSALLQQLERTPSVSGTGNDVTAASARSIAVRRRSADSRPSHICGSSQSKKEQAVQRQALDDNGQAVDQSADPERPTDHVTETGQLVDGAAGTRQSFAPVDDSQVQDYIDKALVNSGGDFDKAWQDLAHQREANCYNMSMTAADHYLFARYLVEDTPAPAAIVAAFVGGYDTFKLITWLNSYTLLGWNPIELLETGKCPTAPPNSSVVRWGLKGVEDGVVQPSSNWA
jgi:hypothetical protein